MPSPASRFALWVRPSDKNVHLLTNLTRHLTNGVKTELLPTLTS